MLIEGKSLCGVFGAIGVGWNQGTIRALALINRERGTDSLGFYDSSGKMIKVACDPDKGLGKENISRWITLSENGGEKREASWFIAGHTRQATRGKVNRQNSHPFRYGKIIGSHNGMVDAPRNYVVDSQYLFDSLNKADGDYQVAWADISGYWGVAWFDGESFYLQVHNGSISVGLDKNGCCYYSSARSHLAACIGYNAKIRELAEGQTLKFTFKGGKVIMDEATTFKSTASEYCSKYDYITHAGTYRQHGGTNKNTYYEDDGPTGIDTPKDYDAEWRESWEVYCTQSEHSRVD